MAGGVMIGAAALLICGRRCRRSRARAAAVSTEHMSGKEAAKTTAEQARC